MLGVASVAVQSWLRQERQTELSRAANDGDLPAVMRCVEAGANIEEGNRMPDGNYGQPPLTLAASTGRTAVVRYLLDHGATANLPGFSNPLIVACWKGEHEVAKLLLERGADPNVRGQGTPLSAAEETHQRELAALIRAHGAKQ